MVDVVVVGTTSEREREGGGSGCVSRWGPPVQWCLLGFGGGWARQSEAKRGRKKEGEERESERKKNPVMDVREGVYKPQLYLLCIACRLWQVKSVEITTYGDFMFLM